MNYRHSHLRTIESLVRLAAPSTTKGGFSAMTRPGDAALRSALWVAAFTFTTVCAWPQENGSEFIPSRAFVGVEPTAERSVHATREPDPGCRGPDSAGRPAAELIASNPSQALPAVLPEDAARRLREIAPSAAIESVGEWEGTAEAIIEDDFANRRSRTHWYLRTPTGRAEMFFAGRSPRVPGSRVRIKGVQSGNRIAVADIMSEDQSAPGFQWLDNRTAEDSSSYGHHAVGAVLS